MLKKLKIQQYLFTQSRNKMKLKHSNLIRVPNVILNYDSPLKIACGKNQWGR